MRRRGWVVAAGLAVALSGCDESPDAPTGTHIEKHIFVADKGDYYDIKDGLPQNEQ